MGDLRLTFVICIHIIPLLWFGPFTSAKIPIHIAGFFPISSDKYYQELAKSVERATAHVNEFENILDDYELRIIWNWTEVGRHL